METDTERLACQGSSDLSHLYTHQRRLPANWSHAFIKHFVSIRGIPRERMSFLPDGVDVEHLRPIPYKTDYAEKMSMTSKKVLTYAGTRADYQGLDVIRDAVILLKDRSDIVFLMVENGWRDND